MAKGRVVGRIQAFLGLIGIIALVVTYGLITGWNPLPGVGTWLRNLTTTSLAKPAPPWSARSGDEPDSAAVLPGAIVVSAAGSVEAHNIGDGRRLWIYNDSWAAAAGGTQPVVVVGRVVGGGFDVYDAMSGTRLWSDGGRDAVWPYRDMLLVMHCSGSFACTLAADDPRSGAHIWTSKINGAAGSMHGLGKPFASLQPINDDYTKALGAAPQTVPPLIGLNLDGDVHVIATSNGHELRVYPANQNQRVVVVGHNVLVATTAVHGGGCTYTLQVRNPTSDATLWTRTGLNAHTANDLGCDQRTDPKGAGGVILATDSNGRDVLLSTGTGNVTYRAPVGAHVIATDGTVAVVRLADGKTLRAVSATSGGQQWTRSAGQGALVGVAPGIVMIADPAANRIVVVNSGSGVVLLNVESGATVLGVGTNYLVVSVGRTFGPLLLPGGGAVRP